MIEFTVRNSKISLFRSLVEPSLKSGLCLVSSSTPVTESQKFKFGHFLHLYVVYITGKVFSVLQV